VIFRIPITQAVAHFLPLPLSLSPRNPNCHRIPRSSPSLG